MTIEELAVEVALLKTIVTELQRQVNDLQHSRKSNCLSPQSPDPRSRWWENLPPPPIPRDSPEEEAIHEARGKYIRQTGDLPPID
jgi:hypothetical protein